MLGSVAQSPGGYVLSGGRPPPLGRRLRRIPRRRLLLRRRADEDLYTNRIEDKAPSDYVNAKGPFFTLSCGTRGSSAFPWPRLWRSSSSGTGRAGLCSGRARPFQARAGGRRSRPFRGRGRRTRRRRGRSRPRRRIFRCRRGIELVREGCTSSPRARPVPKWRTARLVSARTPFFEAAGQRPRRGPRGQPRGGLAGDEAVYGLELDRRVVDVHYLREGEARGVIAPLVLAERGLHRAPSRASPRRGSGCRRPWRSCISPGRASSFARTRLAPPRRSRARRGCARRRA